MSTPDQGTDLAIGRTPRLASRQRVLAMLLLALLCGANLWAFGRLATARQRAADADGGAGRAAELVERIRRLRSGPTRAGVRELRGAEVSRRVEQAAVAAGVDGRNLLRVSPEPSRRPGDGAYLEKPTRVLLQDVTLRQVVQVAHALSSAVPSSGDAGDTPLQLERLRLTAPPGDRDGGQDTPRWTAELTLVQLVYAPRTPPGIAARSARSKEF